MNHIITGGTGFLGTHLTNLLRTRMPDANIYNLDIVRPGTPNPAVKGYKPAVREGESLQSEFIECDVRKPIEDLPFSPTPDDIIFNFAAVHRVPGHEDREYFETNIRGAENVVAFAERHGIRNIVFTSSISVYGTSEERKSEETLPEPDTPYGISKLVAEKTLQCWQSRDAANRRLLILRPGAVFGKGENGNFSRLYRAIKEHKFAYPGRKDTLKACVYVKELANFIMYCVDNGKPGVETYNCTFTPAYTIERIVETMRATTGITHHVHSIPGGLIKIGAALLGACGAPMGICPERVRKLQISTNIDGSKMASGGYLFKWSLPEAFADWYSDSSCKALE